MFLADTKLLNADELAMLSDLPIMDPRDPGFAKQIADTIKLQIDHHGQETADANQPNGKDRQDRVAKFFHDNGYGVMFLADTELLNADELAMLSDLPIMDPRDPGFSKQMADTIKLQIDHHRQETADTKLQAIGVDLETVNQPNGKNRQKRDLDILYTILDTLFFILILPIALPVYHAVTYYWLLPLLVTGG